MSGNGRRGVLPNCYGLYYFCVVSTLLLVIACLWYDYRIWSLTSDIITDFVTVTTTYHWSMFLESTIFVVITAILIPAASIGFVLQQHQGMPISPPSSPQPMARSVTSIKGEDAVDSAAKPTDTQLSLWQRQIKMCGNDVTKGVHRLRQILATQNIVALDGTNCRVYESLYIETLGVIGRAKRSNPKSMIDTLTTMTSGVRPDLIGTICYGSLDPIQQLALQLYSQCPTDACRARTISICNTAPSHTNEQQHSIQTIAMQLLKFGDQPPSIPSYHATFAACAIARDYQYILDMLQSEVLPASMTTLSYNILFTALSRAEQGFLALDILKEMMHQQQLRQNQTIRGNENLNLKKLPPPDLSTFHLTIKALIASKNIDTAYGLLSTMMEFDNWYRQQTMTKETPLRPNSVTFDLLINAYSRMGAWEKVKFVETIQSQYTNSDTCFVFAALPFDQSTNHILTTTTFDATELHDDDDQPIEVSTVRPLPLSYFSSSIRLQWENVGMKKFKNEKYWMIGTYVDRTKGYNFIVALQPHRNPIKNGIKILLYNHDMNTTDAVGTTKVGYLLMINHPVNDAHDNGTLGATRGSSTLLGVYLDPAFRQGGLSKIFIAMWLQLCCKARAVPRTGIMNKPLLALVLQHTFHFVPEVTNGSNGVNVEVSLVANTTATDPSLSVASSSPAAIGIYSSNIKSLQGVFSLRDIRRENILLLREPSSPHRGRSCQIGATFVLSNLMTTTTVLNDVIEQQLLGKSKSGKLVYSTNDLNWENVFFVHNEPQ